MSKRYPNKYKRKAVEEYLRGGKRKYKVEWFPKVKFKPFMTDAKTKGDSLEFTTPSVEATVFEDSEGNWEKHNIFDTESEAIAGLTELFVGSQTA